MQALGLGLPKYDVMEEQGPDHQKRFTIAVSVKGKKMGEGVGKNKKEAEQKAARMALQNIEKSLGEAQKNSDQ
jgi:ribonuclease-3